MKLYVKTIHHEDGTREKVWRDATEDEETNILAHREKEASYIAKYSDNVPELLSDINSILGQINPLRDKLHALEYELNYLRDIHKSICRNNGERVEDMGG